MDARPRPKKPARKLRLSELSVRKAKPRASAYALWDTKESGLALRVQPSGSKSWYFVYSRHGRPRWLRLGDAGAMGLSDVRTRATEERLAIARGKDPAAEKRAERGAGTFADLAERLRRAAREEEQQKLEAGRCADPQACAAALGQAASRHHHARRR